MLLLKQQVFYLDYEQPVKMSLRLKIASVVHLQTGICRADVVAAMMMN
jgi:hypothetical protein